MKYNLNRNKKINKSQSLVRRTAPQCAQWWNPRQWSWNRQVRQTGMPQGQGERKVQVSTHTKHSICILCIS